MRSRGVDPRQIVDLNCDPALSAERQAEARKMLHEVFGPLGELAARACDRAAAAERDATKLRDKFERLMNAPRLRGVVTGVENGSVRVLVGGVERVLPRPEAAALGIGQSVVTDGEARTLLGAAEFVVGGETFEFCGLLEGRHGFVRSLREGQSAELMHVALIADCVDQESLAPGDRVLGWPIDAGKLVLISRRLGKAKSLFADDAGVVRRVARADIIGLEGQIEEIDLLFSSAPGEAYERRLRDAHRALVGVCLLGPTGTGKSTIAEYAVGGVRDRGGRALYRTASHYLSKWVGEGAERMRADFALLDESFAETGVRPLLVVDELEAIAVDRSLGTSLHAGFLDVLDTLLHLLTRTQARMIGISNVADRFIETALLRDGRLRIIRFPATLGADQAAALVARCLSGVALADAGAAADAARLAQRFGEAVSDLIFAADGSLSELLRVTLADGRVVNVAARELATPAAIADGIVRPTLARLALRDHRAGLPEPLPLQLDELRDATVRYFAERAQTITRHNVRNVVPQCIPEDQQVAKVERLLGATQRD